MSKPRVLPVIGCARCGQDHEALTYKQFERPIEDSDGVIWDWWATCPVTGDPILMHDIAESDDKAVKEQG